jgi:hypothetical protein
MTYAPVGQKIRPWRFGKLVDDLARDKHEGLK